MEIGNMNIINNILFIMMMKVKVNKPKYSVKIIIQEKQSLEKEEMCLQRYRWNVWIRLIRMNWNRNLFKLEIIIIEWRIINQLSYNKT